MTIKQLQERVLEANLELVKRNLVILTWGNVSGYDEETGLIAIKASGVGYGEMKAEHMTVLDMDGNVIEGAFKPSTDTPTHLALYRQYAKGGVAGIVHTHSKFATMWAQSGMGLPSFGTTHADYFNGEIPNTRAMTPAEIADNYEENTGKVIIEALGGTDIRKMSAVLVRGHAPFTWGKTPEEAVSHSQILEYVAEMAYANVVMAGGAKKDLPYIQQELADKHYSRKFGPDAYYGQ